jgi:outer membrane biosynthesis protein TonB
MSLKIMCAGCSKDEREQAESDVRKGLGARAAGAETWIVSVVKVQGRWSITLDGPAIRALHCTAPPGYLEQAIREALATKTGAEAPPEDAPAVAAPPAAPAAPPAPAPAPSRAPAPRAAAPAASAARPPAAAPAPAARPSAPPPAAAPRAAPPRAAAPPTSAAAPRATPSTDGSHACESCAQRFRVVYEAIAGEEPNMAPVACPHCWHLNRVPVGENAAVNGDYRAEKA